ncbi:hypothetical protein TNCV_3632321 [Trichonephila clavipes]|nr:hypothetical protein TNCV_3632321 [Trichonephila clavipes]
MSTEPSEPNGQEIKWAETYRGGLKTRDQRRNYGGERWWETRYIRRARLYLNPRSKMKFGTVEIAKEQLHSGFGANELTQARCGITESEPFLRILGIGLFSLECQFMTLFYARHMRHCSERYSKYVNPFAN